MQSSLSALQPSLNGAVIVGKAVGGTVFNGVSTDSRGVTAGNLFVALRGEHFDAHDFLNEVAAKGVAAVVVERVPADLTLPAIKVPDTRIAFGEIARHWRRQFAMPLIAVTGSNGKTTVKEMIASILAAEFGEQYLATRGNLNNEIGVPLTLLRLNAECRAAVVELGMNHPGEIAVLSAIAQPTLGLVNNAQREHQEFMESVEAVAKENGAVLRSLPPNGVAVFPADDPFTPLWREYADSNENAKSMTFGFSADADVTCTYQANDFGSDLDVVSKQLPEQSSGSFKVRLSAAGVHNVRNALAAIACALGIGINVDAIQRGLESFAPVNGRLQRKTASNGALVIDDTYNANPDSVRAAIDVLAHAAAPRVLVLGDMGEVGNDGRQFHEEIGAYAREHGIEHVLTLGDLAAHTASAFGAGAQHYREIALLNQAVKTIVKADTSVLVKGSRFMKMERVVQDLLNQKTQELH